jgi:hypothetical protein
MRRYDSALPPAFSLLRSEFNDFLFASIGEEDERRSLTVLSAFSREGLDPWQEAARLGKLPSETAQRNLACIIAALPNGPPSMAEALTIAGRLVAFLPQRPSLRTRLSAALRWFRMTLMRLVDR